MNAPSLHVSDEALVLRFYDEDDADARALVEAHLATCGACAHQWRTLVATLGLVSAAEPPAADADFDRRLWSHVKRDLAATRRSAWSARNVALVAGWAAVVALAVGVTSTDRHRGSAAVAPPLAAAIASALPASPATSPATTSRERVLLTALSEHFGETEMLLVELLNEPTSSADEFTLEQTMADSLVASGRLYRETATQTGNARLVDALDDVDNVLVDVARGPSRLNATQLRSLRARIEDNDLLFKVRAVSNNVRDRQQTLNAESE